MILAKIQGCHAFDVETSTISIQNATYKLQVAPSKTNNPKSPPYQLVFKDENSPFHDTRITGLFRVNDSSHTFRGDVVRHGRKTMFILDINYVNATALINKL